MLISVIIPCYNRESYIGFAVDSALSQTWSQVEVIVVDDGSSDGSLSILKSYGDRIRLICIPNGGVANARNVGIEAARGEWVALLDSDDCWLPEKLSRQMSVVKTHPECVLLHTLCNTIGADGRQNGSVSRPEEDRFEPDALLKLMHHCFPTTSSVVIRKDILDDLGGFDVDFEQNGGFAAEDWELYVRVAERGPFGYVGEPLTLYRVHADSKTLGDRLRHTRGLIALRSRIESRSSNWAELYEKDDLVEAMKVHHEQYAHVLGRLGTILMSRKEWNEASEAFAKARAVDSAHVKHHVRYLWAKFLATLDLNPARVQNS